MHERLAMQVNLNLDMERMLPNFIKRRYIIKEEEVFPNAPKSVLNTYMLSDNDTLQRIVDEVVAKQTDDQMEQILLNLNKVDKEGAKKEHIDEIKDWLYKAVRGVHNTFEKLEDVDSTSIRDFS